MNEEEAEWWFLTWCEIEIRRKKKDNISEKMFPGVIRWDENNHNKLECQISRASVRDHFLSPGAVLMRHLAVFVFNCCPAAAPWFILAWWASSCHPSASVCSGALRQTRLLSGQGESATSNLSRRVWRRSSLTESKAWQIFQRKVAWLFSLSVGVPVKCVEIAFQVASWV